MATNLNFCQNCHTKPKYYDAATGKLHDFCSKGCAGGSVLNVSIVNGNCEHCHVRPKHRDGIHTHPYCSKSCAKNAGVLPSSQQQPATTTTGSGISPQILGFVTQFGSLLLGPGICSTPGCSKQVYTSPDGTISKYCGKNHKGLGQGGCVYCRAAQKSPGLHLCSQCDTSLQGSAPMIIYVPEDHERFKSVASQFQKSWRHPKACPTVKAVYMIISTQQTLTKYEAYRASVESKGNFASAGRSVGNENRRWHGTSRQCTLGDNGRTQLCSLSSCSLCGIIRTSFSLNLCKRKTGWGRFGCGIYTSSTSSKSNDYSNNGATNSVSKAVLLTKVVVGKGYKMLHDNPSLKSPPPGYDSVLAEIGGSLNYDELVVYREDAVRPSYLVMYDNV